MYDTTFQAKVWPVVIRVMNTYIAPVFNGRLSDSIAVALTEFPYGIYQSQDAGGKNDDYIDQNGWLGQIAIRCIDLSNDNAWVLALNVATALATIDDAVYSVKAHIIAPLKLPVEKITQGSVYTAGLLIEFSIKPK